MFIAVEGGTVMSIVITLALLFVLRGAVGVLDGWKVP
jgi:hypothetical protein